VRWILSVLERRRIEAKFIDEVALATKVFGPGSRQLAELHSIREKPDGLDRIDRLKPLAVVLSENPAALAAFRKRSRGGGQNILGKAMGKAAAAANPFDFLGGATSQPTGLIVGPGSSVADFGLVVDPDILAIPYPQFYPMGSGGSSSSRPPSASNAGASSGLRRRTAAAAGGAGGPSGLRAPAAFEERRLLAAPAAAAAVAVPAPPRTVADFVDREMADDPRHEDYKKMITEIDRPKVVKTPLPSPTPSFKEVKLLLINSTVDLGLLIVTATKDSIGKHFEARDIFAALNEPALAGNPDLVDLVERALSRGVISVKVRDCISTVCAVQGGGRRSKKKSRKNRKHRRKSRTTRKH
jgi:hypothetical protein